MNIRTLSIIALATVAVSSPVLAQEVDGSTTQRALHALRHHRSTYNEVQRPQFAAPRIGTYGDSIPGGRFDRSRPGGLDPDFNPSAS